jgi:FKBP-type peptidyl-prolyl cis-trans isomerase
VAEVQSEQIRSGSGAEAKAGDTAEIHYVGSFPDGRKFDSSRDRGQTFSFKIGAGQVIRGFDAAVTGMKPGEIRKVTIPPELGYGARGAGSAIPPNSTLVFEIELVGLR